MMEAPSTVLKALTLLEFFDNRRTSIGLSEFVKLSGYNKTSTLRFLTALEEKGFVQQNELTRSYTLGPAFLRFAHLRNTAVPFAEAVRIVLLDLNEATQETAQVSAFNGHALSIIGTVIGKHVNRIVFELGEILPLHSTAAGLAYLAYCEPEAVDAALSEGLDSFTAGTLVSPADIRATLATVRRRGISISSDTFEVGVTGFAAPYFGPDGKVNGAVGLSMPTVRKNAAIEPRLAEQVRAAARRLTELTGGMAPERGAEEAAEHSKENGQ